MLQLALDDEATLDLQGAVAQHYARGNIPRSIAEVLSKGGLIALSKDSGRVRGIVVGDAFRRLVGETLAKQYSTDFDHACAPYQFALSTRAGMDCATLLVRAMTDMDQRTILVSIYGIGAFDHIQRARMVSKLMSMPRAAALVPYVMLAYGWPSQYGWVDNSGTTHVVDQGEGGEQGDALKPALYSLARHGALDHAASRFQPGERLLAYLDDVYVLCQPGKAVEAFNVVSSALRELAGVEANWGGGLLG